MSEERLIVFENVSKFYGEVLGVNRVSLAVDPLLKFGLVDRDDQSLVVAMPFSRVAGRKLLLENEETLAVVKDGVFFRSDFHG